MDWLVLLPPVIAIVLALWTRQVFLSLITGLWFGATLLVGGNPILGVRETVEQMVWVFQEPGNTRIVFFCLLVGGLIALVQASGGVSGFVAWAQRKGWGVTRRGAELLAIAVGLVVFVESSITSLTVGAVSRPFFDRLKIAREKLAYYCDATSAPVCMMLPFNGWGAYLLGLLAAQGAAEGAVGLLVRSLAFNFFSYLAVALALFMALSGRRYGLMKKAEVRAEEKGELIRPGSTPLISEEVATIAPEPDVPEKAVDLFVPILTMVAMIFVSLWITGDGDIMAGSGSTSVLWAVGTAIIVGMLQYAMPRPGRKRPLMPIRRSIDLVLKGMSGLVPVTILIILAFAIGQVSRELEMGPYLVGVIGEDMPAFWLPAIVFMVSGFVSFTLGSSWTCFAIVLPIALPLAGGMGIYPPLMLGAVLSGGVFGDQASPLSDTTIISSMAAACDHVDHVNTQMPYALFTAGLSLLMFVVAGILMT